MAREIERKFLVAGQPEPDAVLGHTALRQGYLAVDDRVEVRLREADGTTRLTVKVGAGLDRTEVEVELAPVDADQLWPHAMARSVHKVRTQVTTPGGSIAELDDYRDNLAGLRTVEVEFTDRESARAFTPPAWFGREVTGESGWSNAQLASHGSPVPIDTQDAEVDVGGGEPGTALW